MKKSSKVIWSVVIVGAMAAMIVPRLMKPKEIPDPVAPPTIHVVNAELGGIELSTGLIGKVEPSDVVSVTPKISGEVLQMMVKIGDVVREGQTICKIDNSQIDSIKISLDVASVALADAKTNLNRMQVLYSSGDISAQAFEQAQSAVKNTQLQYDSAKLNYDNQVKYSTVTAPISGLIESCDTEVHDVISPQTPICVISGRGAKAITFSVTERIVDQLNMGDLIRIEKNGNEYQAKISEISSMIDAATGLFRIKATVEDGDSLPTGISAKLYVTSEKVENVLTLPVDVIYYDGGDSYVYTYGDEVVHKLPIEVGIYDSKRIQIISGITADDQVITTWTPELYEGAPAVLASADEVPGELSEPAESEEPETDAPEVKAE